MKLGVFTPLLSDLSLDAVLAKLAAINIHTVELGTGSFPGDAHCKLSMLDSPAELDRFQSTLAKHNATVSALSCHSNPLHPQPAIAAAARETSRRTILLAARLGVSTVVDFSGCPGDCATAQQPNWITCPWPPHFFDTLRWQWDTVAAPFWQEHAAFAADHGVRLAIEMHPGFLAYSPETLLHLRDLAGPSLGCNFDPSHLFWQGIDPLEAVRILGDAIFHVHAKDTQLFPANLARTGVLDTKPYTDERHRAWIFRTVGYGHDGLWWRSFVSALRLHGYDGTLSIEHEDSLMSPEEGLTKAATFLHSVLIEHPPGTAWWA